MQTFARLRNQASQLLQKHLRAGRVQRVRRGVYRLVHFPPGEHEDLAAVWLWSDRAGVFSHETALSLHGLSDVLPARVHLTVPSDWCRRRLRVPQGVVLAYADVPKVDRTWGGAVQVTAVRRTLADCLAAGVSPDLVQQAIESGRQERASYLPHLGITCLLDMGNGAAYVHRDSQKERMVPLPVVGHWLKKAWGTYYTASKRRQVPRLPGI